MTEEERTLKNYLITIQQLKGFTQACQKAVPELFDAPVTYIAGTQYDLELFGKYPDTQKRNLERVMKKWDEIFPDQIGEDAREFTDPKLLSKLPPQAMYRPVGIWINFAGPLFKKDYVIAYFEKTKGGYIGGLQIHDSDAGKILMDPPYQALKRALSRFERKKGLKKNYI